MRHTTLFGSLLLATLLTACGGSDDTPPPPNNGGPIQPPPEPPPEPQPPTPPTAKCDVWHPTIPAGQTYAAVQTLDRLDVSGTARFSHFIASGVGIPTDKGYGQLYLPPNDTRSPVRQLRAQLIEFGDCPRIFISNDYSYQNFLSADHTIRKFAPNALQMPHAENPIPGIQDFYILDVFDYGASGKTRVEFHIDPSKYPGNQIFDENKLQICTIHFGYGIFPLYCPKTSIRREGGEIIASATISGGRPHFNDLVLASTQPRGFESVKPKAPPKIFELSSEYLNTSQPAGYPEVCGPRYEATPDHVQDRPGNVWGISNQFNQHGVGVFSEFTFYGKKAPDDDIDAELQFVSYLDAQEKRTESAKIMMSAWTDCTHGRITNLQRNIHANETITSFARNKNFGGEMQYQNLHVLEGFAYSGFDPHIGKRVQFTIDSLRYPEAIQKAPKDIFRICKLSYQSTGTNLTCAKTQVRALSDYWTFYAEFDDPHIGQWIEHDEEYLLTATTPRGRDTLVTP
ncbi:hypothetical protein EBQ26_05855 [Allofranklinella schreckenbergeri]|uniref:Uncharacterized protein n=1 Tax=Allofranklinella schreckenbergeri TaxID=1076744 RepID=A0A3M6Q8V9_9BURK|nr:hypothetical protein [Allofranklinella schreckenbergeri]RMW98838.1 hypothetical protein EBQ26_05855 [Allofranklinella schreckenbergeri]